MNSLIFCSNTMADKITWIGTGWRKLVRKYDSYGKYPDSE